MVQRKIIKTACILLIGYIIGYVIPAWICQYEKGFTKEQVNQILAANLNKYHYHGQDSVEIRNYLFTDSIEKNIDTEILGIKSKYPFDSNKIKEINRLETTKDNLDDSVDIIILSFTDSKMSIVWPFSITGILLIIFVILELKPEIKNIKWSNFIPVFLAITTIYIVLIYLRTNETEGRVIYSVYNKDINPYIFYYQVGLYILFILCTVIIWTNYQKLCCPKKDYDYTFDGIFATLNNTKKCYNTWQLFSVILAVAFGPLLYNLYSHVFTDDDQRYLFQAIFFNILYFITWLTGSIPLISQFDNWKLFKNKILFDKSIEAELDRNKINIEELKNVLPGYEITSSLNHVVTVVLSGVSFLIPFLKPYLEKMFTQ